MASAAVQRPQAELFSAPANHSSQPFIAAKNPNLDRSYQPRDVTTSVNYHKDNEDGSPPAPSYVGKPETYERPALPQTVTVHDIRGSEEKYTLDSTGFQIVKHESQEKDFLDDEQIKRVYYAETEELLKKSTGASKVFIFDHTIRRQPQDSRTADPNAPKPAEASLRGPVQRVHIDQSYAAAKTRVPHHLPDEAEYLLGGRYQIINVWRPIKTVLKDPLAVADATTVQDSELVTIKLIYPDREGETSAVRASETGSHRWHYLNQQTPREVLLIKCFDSKTDGKARRVPHTAFVDEERENEEKRESIEVRALVFHEHDRD
ncbi:hypothetical protein PVAG01_08794 [Phlyctema vagabunda]|uniref:Methyltransferase n=1 Tax=Phlyctema vagabunda TaxID=108571 RepID=A0ABR4PAE7_9HELO